MVWQSYDQYQIHIRTMKGSNHRDGETNWRNEGQWPHAPVRTERPRYPRNHPAGDENGQLAQELHKDTIQIIPQPLPNYLCLLCDPSGHRKAMRMLEGHQPRDHQAQGAD
jgi:hypothetical protein